MKMMENNKNIMCSNQTKDDCEFWKVYPFSTIVICIISIVILIITALRVNHPEIVMFCIFPAEIIFVTLVSNDWSKKNNKSKLFNMPKIIKLLLGAAIFRILWSIDINSIINKFLN
jgi:hypothetical protein